MNRCCAIRPGLASDIHDLAAVYESAIGDLCRNDYPAELIAE